MMFNLKIPQSIFVHADGFLKAAQKNDDPPHPLDMVPMVTASAFAAELYLKCLIHLETGTLFRFEHNLKKLFSKLADPTQAEITRRFEAIPLPDYKITNPSPEAEKAIQMRLLTLKETLKAGAEAFVEWRYLYEDAGGKNIFGLFPLPPILREVILERKPEWRFFSIKMTKIGSVPPTSPAPKTPEPDGKSQPSQ